MDLPGLGLRLIPACAGRATSPRQPGRDPAAHPRMRGEGTWLTGLKAGRKGSSPHARGGQRHTPSRTRGVRLIPACAGRASVARRPRRVSWAHPRMRGEGGITP